MPLTEINHVNFRTDRDTMLKLRDFYCDILGLTVGKRVASTTYGYWLYIGSQVGWVLEPTRDTIGILNAWG